MQRDPRIRQADDVRDVRIGVPGAPSDPRIVVSQAPGPSPRVARARMPGILSVDDATPASLAQALRARAQNDRRQSADQAATHAREATSTEGCVDCCAVEIPGEYRAEDATGITYIDEGSRGTGEVLGIGDSTLDPADTSALDVLVARYMQDTDTPNGSVAVISSDGRLVHCKGYTNTLAFARSGEAATFWAGPHSRFHIASVSKTFTAWTVLKLWNLGLIPNIGGTIDEYLDLSRMPVRTEGYGHLAPLADEVVKPTIFQCLTYTGGFFDDNLESTKEDTKLVVSGVWDLSGSWLAWEDWSWKTREEGVHDSTISYMADDVAAANHATWPVTQDHLFRYMNLWPLAFTPGEVFCYSSYGIWLCGRVIEAATCRGYESVVEQLLLRPLGMGNTVVGGNRRTDREVNEAPMFGYEWPGDPAAWKGSWAQSYRDDSGDYTAEDYSDYQPYARRDLRLVDASGGWISTAYDLALFMREMFDGRSLLSSPGLYDLLTYPWVPRGPASASAKYAGMAWFLGGSPMGAGSAWKTGHHFGARAFVCSLPDPNGRRDGMMVAYLFNRNRCFGTEDEDKDAEEAFRAEVLAYVGALRVSPTSASLFGALPEP
jgi:CubicO group peptidase (beta-lactamase class C family)